MSSVMLDSSPSLPTDAKAAPRGRGAHPVRSFLWRRSALGVVAVVVVAIIVYFVTLVLPGDAATAILGSQATPERLAQLRDQLGLDRPVLSAFGSWVSNIFHGEFGTSLASGQSVTGLVGPRLENSVVLVVFASICSTALGIVLGAIAAARRDKVLDNVSSVVSLVASALPEFTVGVFVVLFLSIKLATGLSALSLLPAGASILDQPDKLVLPLITLIIVCTPYVFRMTRAAVIDALVSDYAEVARLKGVSERRLVFRHALPNALAPIIQVIGLNLLYLAGGIVLVESVFQYPGIGLTLVSAVTSRDVPLIQFLVLILSVFYVVVNILTDLAVLLATPRKRRPR